MTTPQISLNTNVAAAAWRRIPELYQKLRQAGKVTLSCLPRRLRVRLSLNLLLTTNTSIRRLNRDFRGIDKPTNVLSFPQFNTQELSKMGKKGSVIELGDIAIAYQYVVVEAKKDHKILINHVIHLFIHGLLHLFGYDHLNDKEAGKMERLEERIMAELGLPNPYKLAATPKGKSPKTGRKARK